VLAVLTGAAREY